MCRRHDEVFSSPLPPPAMPALPAYVSAAALLLQVQRRCPIRPIFHDRTIMTSTPAQYRVVACQVRCILRFFRLLCSFSAKAWFHCFATVRCRYLPPFQSGKFRFSSLPRAAVAQPWRVRCDVLFCRSDASQSEVCQRLSAFFAFRFQKRFAFALPVACPSNYRCQPRIAESPDAPPIHQFLCPEYRDVRRRPRPPPDSCRHRQTTI